MNKLKAIWKIIKSEHFYLITSNKELSCNEIHSDETNQVTIAQMIALYWATFWKGIYINNIKDGEKYV